MREHLSELLVLALGAIVGISMIASPVLRWVYGS